MQFKQLRVGARFVFESEINFPLMGLAKGPWIKLSARCYRHETHPSLSHCQVGTVRVRVNPC
jgi:hypothetical protein